MYQSRRNGVDLIVRVNKRELKLIRAEYEAKSTAHQRKAFGKETRLGK